MNKIKKLISTVLAAGMLVTSINTFAMSNISFIDNGDGTATVSATDTSKLAVAQYDGRGAMKTFALSSLVAGKQSATFDFDGSLKTNIFSFTDWNTLASNETGYKIGNKTISVVDFDGETDGPFVYYNLNAADVNTAFSTTDKNGNPTKALKISRIEGTTDIPNFQFGDLVRHNSDFIVYEFDVQVNDVNTEWNGYIKSVNAEGETDGWTRLFTIENNNATTSKITFHGNGSGARQVNNGWWYTIAAVVDYKADKVSYYVNGDRVTTQNFPTDVDPNGPKYPDILQMESDGDIDIVIDNVKVYEGTQPRVEVADITTDFDLTRDAITEHDETAYRSILNGKYAVHTRSGVAINTTGTKTLLAHKPYIDNGEVYVHKSDLASAWGVTAPSVSANGEGYVKLSDFASGMGMTLFSSVSNAEINSGLYVVASSFATPASNQLQGLNDFMFYLRPSAEDVTAMYEASPTNGVHPRIMATQADFDRIHAMYEAGTDAKFMEWANAVIALANHQINNAAPVYQPAAEGRLNGAQRQIIADMATYGVAFYLTEDDRYVDAAYADLEAFCNFPDWNPTSHLDTAEIMSAFAIGYDWFYNEFDTTQRQTIENAAFTMGMYPSYRAFLSAGTEMTNAFNAENNHGTVCNGGLMGFALAFMDVYPEECAWLVSNSLEGMEYNIYNWNTGAWYEGPGYWEYAIDFTVKFISSMETALGSDLGFLSLEGLDEAGALEIAMQSPIGVYNYSDAALAKMYVPEMLWLSNKYNTPEVATKMVETFNGTYAEGNRRKGEPMAMSVLWYNPDMIGQSAVFPNDMMNEKLDVATIREGWGANDTFVGIKAGDMLCSHSQLDAGSFIFESDGIRWLAEIGQGQYQSEYWRSEPGGERWKFIAARAEGHSTVSVNPADVEDMNVRTQGGASAHADITAFTSTDCGVITTVDMADVLFDVSAAERGFFFTDNRQSLVVRDEITTTGTNDTVYWYLIISPNVTVNVDSGTKTITLTQDGKTCTIKYDVQGGTIAEASYGKPIESTTLTDMYSHPYQQGRVVLKITGVSGDVDITAKITPNSVTSPTDLSVYLNDIDSWSLTD